MNENPNKGNACLRHYSCIYQNGVPKLCHSPLLTLKPKLLGVEEGSCHNTAQSTLPSRCLRTLYLPPHTPERVLLSKAITILYSPIYAFVYALPFSEEV